MVEDELIKIWQSSSNHEQIKFKKSKLMLELKYSLNSFQKSWKNMELRETIAAIIVILFFGYKLYFLSDIVLIIGHIWIILASIYIIIRLGGVKKYKEASYAENYVDYLEKTGNYLNVQKKMLDSVIYWYFLPIGIGILIVFIGSTGDAKMLALKIIGLIALGVFVHYLNKWSAKKYITPRLEKIESLKKIMQE